VSACRYDCLNINVFHLSVVVQLSIVINMFVCVNAELNEIGPTRYLKCIVGREI